MDFMDIVWLALAAVVGLLVGALVHKSVTTKRIGDADELAKRIVEEARKEAQAQKKEILIQGQDDLFNQKRELENEFKEREREVKLRERKLEEMGGRLEEKLEKATAKEHELLAAEKDLARKERQLAESEEFLQTRIDEEEQRLSEIAGLTAEEAKARLFAEVEAKTRHESAKMIRQIETEAKETADRKAKEILCNVIQRYAGDYVNEQTVTAVSLPSEDMKGRIIGREGRNIRALEAATGVDLIIDDTPETVILSAYSPLRRQVAKMALERLIQDGRIHPARIEDIVQKCEQELDAQVREVGEQATFDAGVHGIHPEIIRLLGQLRYRTSFTQNVLQHSLEVSALCGMMAAELGMDVKKAKRAGLLHDIGKSKIPNEIIGKPGKLTDSEYEEIKKHPVIGYNLVKNLDIDQRIKNAVLLHHERFDGKGYPLGLTGNEIDDFTSIVSIADVYDAMTANRCYRDGLCPFEVIAMFEKEGLTQFNPKYILTFLDHIANTYINNEVLLSDGSSGKIVLINKKLTRPTIQLDNGNFVNLESRLDLYVQAII